MYAIYDTRATVTSGSVLPDIFADVIAILTGETDKNNLIEASINLPTTSISANTPAGWTVWDNNTGVANEVILRAPCIDDPAQYKYVKVSLTNNSSYMTFNFAIMEDWDSGTNTPTNICDADAVNLMRLGTQTYGIQPLRIRATARYIWLGPSGYSSGWSGWPAMEISRTHPCLAVGTGRVPCISLEDVAWVSTSTNIANATARIPRIISDTGTVDLTDVPMFQYPSVGPFSFQDPTVYAQWDRSVQWDKDGQKWYGANLIQFDYKPDSGNVAGYSNVSRVYITRPDRSGGVAGPLDESVHMLNNEAVRVMVSRNDLQATNELSVRYLFPLADE